MTRTTLRRLLLGIAGLLLVGILVLAVVVVVRTVSLPEDQLEVMSPGDLATEPASRGD